MSPPVRIDDALLDHLCQLACLELTPGRRDTLRAQLDRLVDAFAALGDADLGADLEAPRALTVDDLRADEPCDEAPAARALQNAPRSAADSFLVPRVVEP